MCALRLPFLKTKVTKYLIILHEGSDNKTKKELHMNEKGKANYELKICLAGSRFPNSNVRLI